MIRSFLHKGLKDLYETSKSASVPPELVERCKLRLAALDRAAVLSDVNLPGFNFHPLKGFKPARYSIHVSGRWAITFGWQPPDAYRVDLEQYH